ncbi:MAG: aspartyl protease family protein, partial [Bacteroidales bacterium]
MKNYLVIFLGCIIGVIGGIAFYYKPWLQFVSLEDQHSIDISVDHDRINIPVQIGDTTIKMLWDTGAERTVLSIDVADKLCIKYDTTNLSYMSVLAGTVVGDNYGVFGCNM